ncbi:MAG: hypothetical protein ACRDPK_20830 [Carbonactinosporaceae bacterium]
MNSGMNSGMDAGATTGIESRVEALAQRDRMIAVIFTVALWVVLLFVFAVSNAAAPTVGASLALVASLLALGVFNTASMVALIRRYGADKDMIYREDIVNLDRLRHERSRRGR